MPELPEVETMVRDMNPVLAGRVIRSALVTHTDILSGVTGRALTTGLTGARVLRLERRAKNAVIITNRRRLIIQPGMTGSMFVKRRLAPEDVRYGVLKAVLDDGRTFIYHDVRRLGTLRWVDQGGWDRFSAALGPEPLDPAFTPAVLGQALGRSKAAVKKVIMDQKHLAGVGNIYANEALFSAGIDPSRPANTINPDEQHRLHHHIVRILTNAVNASGTTIRDYRTGTGEPGNFQGELDVYDREGEPCKRCGTILAGTHTIDARITVFCYRCQR